ncbi:MAG: Holliday junction resolvase RuvX [Jatrophihabitantaceae bacterium]
MTQTRDGVRLGVDPGRVRVGVAVSDPAGRLATPLLTLPRKGAIEALARLVDETSAVDVIVGLPRSLSGAAGPAESTARAFAEELGARVAPIPVHLSDERFTTTIATRTLSGRGVRGKAQRAVVDQAAAVLILQSWLDRRDEGQPSDGQPGDEHSRTHDTDARGRNGT